MAEHVRLTGLMTGMTGFSLPFAYEEKRRIRKRVSANPSYLSSVSSLLAIGDDQGVTLLSPSCHWRSSFQDFSTKTGEAL